MSKDTQINWHNEATAIVVKVLEDAPENFTDLELTLLPGRTVADGETVKRAAWRIKAQAGTAEFVEANAAKAVNAAVRAKFGGTKFHDVAGAIAGFKLPELQDEAEDKPETDWTKFANAAELARERDLAGDAASVFLKGEADMRMGLKDLGKHIANVAEALEKPKAFAAWVASGSEALQKLLKNQNAKSELVFVGKLPDDYFAAMPDTSNGAKAVQRNFNLDKNALAEAAAADAWGKKKNSPKAGEAQKRFLEALSDARGWAEGGKELLDNPSRQHILARHFWDALQAASDEGAVLVIAETEAGFEPAKDGEDRYIAGTMFGTGNRPNELVLAFCKAMAAAAPEAKAEKAEKAAEAQAAAAVKPRTFAQYGVTEAAMHLARILSSREDWAEVLDSLNGMADWAEADTWSQVLADVQKDIDADKAAAEKAAAETSGDDDA